MVRVDKKTERACYSLIFCIFAKIFNTKLMKKLLLLVGMVVVLTSCVSKQVAEQTAAQRDSLEQVVAAKDSLIRSVFADINAISDNLAEIKVRENIITKSEQEGLSRPIDQINSDLAAIEELMEENRRKIEELQRSAGRLRKANLRIKELERWIADMNDRLADKDTEISALRAEVTAKNLELQQLSEQMAAEQQAHRAEVESLSSDKAALDRSLHTIYYIVGQEKKLREAQIISKEGLIGRTLVVAKQNSLDFFMQADSRELLEVAINQKKAEIVTSHPEGSYELIKGADKTILKLVITDPTRFWESSKMLIVSYR